MAHKSKPHVSSTLNQFCINNQLTYPHFELCWDTIELKPASYILSIQFDVKLQVEPILYLSEWCSIRARNLCITTSLPSVGIFMQLSSEPRCNSPLKYRLTVHVSSSTETPPRRTVIRRKAPWMDKNKSKRVWLRTNQFELICPKNLYTNSLYMW